MNDCDSAASFATTHWSLVLSAGAVESPQARSALESLCRSYWYPLYAFIRRRGYPQEDARDLVQSFFAHILGSDFLARARRDKGRFRSYLLGALNYFLADERSRDQCQKRGGGQEMISVDAIDAEERYRFEPVDQMDAAKLFLRRWAMTLVDQALRRLEAEMLLAGKERLFARLEGFLVGEKGGGTYANAAVDLGLSEAAVKMAISRLRQRCRELLREEIAQTVPTPAEVDEEYRMLIAALRG